MTVFFLNVIVYAYRTHDFGLINIEDDNFSVLPKRWKTLNNVRSVCLKEKVKLN